VATTTGFWMWNKETPLEGPADVGKNWLSYVCALAATTAGVAALFGSDFVMGLKSVQGLNFINILLSRLTGTNSSYVDKLEKKIITKEEIERLTAMVSKLRTLFVRKLEVAKPKAFQVTVEVVDNILSTGDLPRGFYDPNIVDRDGNSYIEDLQDSVDTLQEAMQELLVAETAVLVAESNPTVIGMKVNMLIKRFLKMIALPALLGFVSLGVYFSIGMFLSEPFRNLVKKSVGHAEEWFGSFFEKKKELEGPQVAEIKEEKKQIAEPSNQYITELALGYHGPEDKFEEITLKVKVNRTRGTMSFMDPISNVQRLIHLPRVMIYRDENALDVIKNQFKDGIMLLQSKLHSLLKWKDGLEGGYDDLEPWQKDLLRDGMYEYQDEHGNKSMEYSQRLMENVAEIRKSPKGAQYDKDEMIKKVRKKHELKERIDNWDVYGKPEYERICNEYNELKDDIEKFYNAAFNAGKDIRGKGSSQSATYTASKIKNLMPKQGKGPNDQSKKIEAPSYWGKQQFDSAERMAIKDLKQKIWDRARNPATRDTQTNKNIQALIQVHMEEMDKLIDKHIAPNFKGPSKMLVKRSLLALTVDPAFLLSKEIFQGIGFEGPNQVVRYPLTPCEKCNHRHRPFTRCEENMNCWYERMHRHEENHITCRFCRPANQYQIKSIEKKLEGPSVNGPLTYAMAVQSGLSENQTSIVNQQELNAMKNIPSTNLGKMVGSFEGPAEVEVLDLKKFSKGMMLLRDSEGNVQSTMSVIQDVKTHEVSVIANAHAIKNAATFDWNGKRRAMPTKASWTINGQMSDRAIMPYNLFAREIPHDCPRDFQAIKWTTLEQNKGPCAFITYNPGTAYELIYLGGNYEFTPEGDISHNFTTFGTSCGSLLYDYKSKAVFGIHYMKGEKGKNNMAMHIDSKKG
jgi:hypothetical protein